MSNAKTDVRTQPEQQTSDAVPNRDLSDAELANVDGGFGVLSVAGSSKSSKRRPVDMRDVPRPKIPSFTEA